MSRTAVLWILVCLAGLAAVSSELGRTLLFGWIGFIVQTFPRARVNPAGILSGLVVFLLLVAGVHWLARSFRRQSEDGTPAPGLAVSRWRFRWSLSIVVAVVVMFAVGFSAVGIARHAGWLLSSEESWYGPHADTWSSSSNSQLKHIGLGVSNYSDVYRQLPAGGTVNEYGEGQHSWVTQILFGMNYTTDTIRLDLPWDAPENADIFKRVVPALINPGFRVAPVFDQSGYGLAHYAANEYVMHANSALKLSGVTDGTGHTIAVGEVSGNFRPWGDAFNYRDPALGINVSPHGFGGPTGGGANFLMLDGSVQFFSQDTNSQVLRSLSTPCAND